jgi:DNA polymerase I
MIWFVDFEFGAAPGERPGPVVCLVARCLETGQELRLWEDELRARLSPPYPTGPDTTFVAYYASAELGCHLALGWPLPQAVIDLYAEFRCLTNGQPLPCGSGLLGAMAYYGLPAIDIDEKDAMRTLALRGGPWTHDERQALLDYCASDVRALGQLWNHMVPQIDVPRARLRGRYMAAAARIEHAGIPINGPALERLRSGWDGIKDALIAEVDQAYGVYDEGSFRADRFARWLAGHEIAWPRLPSGALALDDDTFRTQARAHPELHQLRELRHALSQLRLNDLAVGRDGRNRCLLSAFRARTGRNQPSNTKFIFGPAVWLRGLIQPPPGRAVAYVDWNQQEFGIAAVLSGDGNMLAAYESGDPYLAFARQAGAVSSSATKHSHGAVREQYKTAALAVQYGQEAESLAVRLGQPVAGARQLLRDHRMVYRRFWKWSDGVLDFAQLRGQLWTTFGWRLAVGPETNRRALRNWPMQANGNEMLRLACILATERGVTIVAPVHDAVLIEAPQPEIEHAVAVTQQAMADASAAVLAGFRLRSDANVVRYPDRYRDPRGEQMWTTVQGLLARKPVVRQWKRSLTSMETIVAPCPSPLLTLLYWLHPLL